MKNDSFINFLNAKIMHWEKNFCEWSLTVTPNHLNSQDSLHGGVIATLLDDACSYSGFYRPEAKTTGGAVTVSLTINYIAKISQGRVFARGRCIGGGKRIYFAEGELVSEEGVLLARATGSFRRHNSNYVLP